MSSNAHKNHILGQLYLVVVTKFGKFCKARSFESKAKIIVEVLVGSGVDHALKSSIPKCLRIHFRVCLLRERYGSHVWIAMNCHSYGSLRSLIFYVSPSLCLAFSSPSFVVKSLKVTSVNVLVIVCLSSTCHVCMQLSTAPVV